MIIEFKIPNGTMKVNADTFFQEATKAKIRKMLKCFKDSGSDQEDVQELKNWLQGEIEVRRTKAVRYVVAHVSQRTTLKELVSQYDQMCSPCYAAYTRDKAKLAEAKKAVSRCKIQAAASGRKAERAKSDLDRWTDIFGIVEKIIGEQEDGS